MAFWSLRYRYILLLIRLTRTTSNTQILNKPLRWKKVQVKGVWQSELETDYNPNKNTFTFLWRTITKNRWKLFCTDRNQIILKLLQALLPKEDFAITFLCKWYFNKMSFKIWRRFKSCSTHFIKFNYVRNFINKNCICLCNIIFATLFLFIF